MAPNAEDSDQENQLLNRLYKTINATVNIFILWFISIDFDSLESFSRKKSFTITQYICYWTYASEHVQT